MSGTLSWPTGSWPHRMVEVWCDCPPEEIRRRYGARDRHAGHYDADLLPQLAEVLVGAQPLAIGEVVRVSTVGAVDLDVLVLKVRAALAG